MTWESLGSCDSYLVGQATIKVALPKKVPYCKYCQPYLKYEQFYDRFSCRITGEFIMNPNKERGEMCPFEWECTE